MAKAKQKQLAANPEKISLDNSFSFGSKADLHEEDSWVVVKKQKVTILLPSLPVTEMSTKRKPKQSQLQTACVEVVVEPQPEPLIDTCPNRPLAEEQEKATHCYPTKQCPTQYVPPPPMRKVHKVSSASKSRLVHCPSRVGENSLLNQKLRALILEKKLEKAGGFSRWLVDLGLEQFVKIFQRRRMGKFQVVNLTMKKLKDMGAIAVGPRRKLLHAIDCVCHPCY